MNTPYAYAIVQGEDGRENVSLQFDHPEMCGQKYNAVIPLYTHPVKELKLTNDKIREIGDECILNNNGILNWIDFAGAILRKASEK